MEAPAHLDQGRVTRALQTQTSIMQIAQSITALQLAGKQQAKLYQRRLDALAGGPSLLGNLPCEVSPLKHCLYPVVDALLSPCLYCQKASPDA